MLESDWKALAQWALSALGGIATVLFAWHHNKLVALEERIADGEKKMIADFAALKSEVLEAMREGFAAEAKAREEIRKAREEAERRESVDRQESSRRIHGRLDAIAEDVAHIRGRLDGK